MPYIKLDDRNSLSQGKPIETSGELNYSLTALIDSYVILKGLSYSTINDVIGALEGAKLEFYRRIAVPYEEIKLKENGEAYKCGQ